MMVESAAASRRGNAISQASELIYNYFRLHKSSFIDFASPTSIMDGVWLYITLFRGIASDILDGGVKPLLTLIHGAVIIELPAL